ncbi:hypothetical protein HUJ04_005945 [Dendroctonus ponderosae]|uniref:VWFC domain-containing protein n=1 Tax=Dendroctonus ponderosae TaxID=77166 RepID=A0AAR5NYR8_DENPD|nr:hypothetical protein HUJ04_005945 [Dendroctonus ponderosae]
MYTTVLMLLNIMPLILTSENCDKYGILLYEDIGCKPVMNATESCPSRYDCNFSRPKSGCTFKGKNYNPGEDIESELTYSACSIGCRCEDFNFIRCAVLDCPEHLGGYPEPDCLPKYELGKCCATEQICNATAEAKTCQVDGETYSIGAKFYPKNTCFSCICHANFTGEYDEETCMRQNCVAEIYSNEQINQKCAPAYFNFHSDEVLCCPNEFLCPEPTDDIKVVNFQADANATFQCQYGAGELKVGEGFHRRINKYGKDRNLLCECIMPPLVTCREV